MGQAPPVNKIPPGHTLLVTLSWSHSSVLDLPLFILPASSLCSILNPASPLQSLGLGISSRSPLLAPSLLSPPSFPLPPIPSAPPPEPTPIPLLSQYSTYRACPAGQLPTATTLCEAGATAQGPGAQDLSAQVLACPPAACLPYGCPSYTFAKLGISACGVNTSVPVGTTYT